MPIIWYKEKRTKEIWARRVRDWSDNHIEQFIRAWQVLNNE